MTRSFARFPHRAAGAAASPVRLLWRSVAVCLALTFVTLAAASVAAAGALAA